MHFAVSENKSFAKALLVRQKRKVRGYSGKSFELKLLIMLGIVLLKTHCMGDV